MRERLDDAPINAVSPRITPACAGKTGIFIMLHLFKWDHPRVCGKDIRIYEEKTGDKGSPPRVRERPA